MKTPKEKAEELTNKFYSIEGGDIDFSDAKQCALICVDQILNLGEEQDVYMDYTYWSEVSEEIKKQ